MTQKAMKMSRIGTIRPMSQIAVPPPGSRRHGVRGHLLDHAGHEPDDERGDREGTGDAHQDDADELVLEERPGRRILERAADSARERREDAEGAPGQEGEADDRHASPRLGHRVDHAADELRIERRSGRHLLDHELARLRLAQHVRPDHHAQHQELEDGQDAEVGHAARVLERPVRQEAADRAARDPGLPVPLAPRVEVGQEALGSIDHSVALPRKGRAA